MGLYKDEMFCDAAPRQAGYLLFVRPWKYDRKAIQQQVKNTYTFVKDKKTFIMNSLTPQPVYDALKKMRKKEMIQSEKKKNGIVEGKRIEQKKKNKERKKG